MEVSIIVPARASEMPALAASLEGILAQRHPDGRIEVFVVQYGARTPALSLAPAGGARLLAVDHPSPYAARNLAASQARGEILLFTEPGAVPEPDWVAGHVARLRDSAVTVSVGRIAPARTTRLVDMFSAYEDSRDAWVFSSPHWAHYFGRPMNMAVARRRFETHGPFAEVARGADSTLVQKVAREVSCAEIALAPDAIVRRQSIRGLPSCWRERFAHGRALQNHRSAHAAPIALRDRIELFRSTLRQQGYGPRDAATLLALVAAGMLVFRAGGWAGVVARTAPPRTGDTGHSIT